MVFLYKKTLPLLTGLSLISGLLPFAQPALAADREPFADVAYTTLGSLDSFVVKKDGTLWATGENTHGQLGLGTHFDQFRLTLVPSLTDVQSAATEDDTTLVVKKDGTVYGMGKSYVGMFADGTRPYDDQLSPVQVKDPADPTGFLTGVKQVALGGASFALKQDGTVWQWGNRVLGGVDPSTLNLSQRPVQVPNLTHVVAITPGNFALKDDGTVWQWATADSNIHSGNIAHPGAAVQVDGLSDVKQIVGLTVGGGMAVKNDGTVWQWGDHDYSYDPPKAPHIARGFENTHDVAAFSDQYGRTVIKQDGTVWTATELMWTYDRGYLTPQLNQITGVHDVTTVSNYGNGYWAIETDGSLWAWGQNGRNTLGTTQDTTKGPVQVEAGSTTQYIDLERWANYRRITFNMPDHNLKGSKISVTGRYDLQGYPLAGSQLNVTVTAKSSGTQLAQQQLTTDVDGSFKFDLQGSENWELGTYVITVKRPDDLNDITHEFQIEEQSDKLTDITNHWARNDILSLYDQGIVSGYPDNTFHPDEPVTRAQIAKMFAGAKDIILRNDPSNILNKYADSKNLPGWASQEIAKMTQEGTLHGYNDGAFHPNDHVTREQMATIFAGGQAYAQLVKADLTRFRDENDISGWAQNYVAYNLLSNGMQGMLEDGSWYFRPQKDL
ncbi:MAG: S-layer homology domain-containing protein, partial [Tumebacillaceae bacterium]